MKFDSYITSGTKTALTVKNYTEFVNKTDFNKKRFSLKKAAFTLAETLITLTIIGVVAALTIPNLISSYQKHTYVVGLKKAYSQLQNAVKMIPITQGCPAGDLDCAGWNEGGHNENGQWVNTPVTNIEGQEFSGYIANKRLYLLSKQFKINKLCYSYNNSTDETCQKFKSHFNNALSAPAFITNTGVIWGAHSYDQLNLDINGFAEPNKYGRDQFVFSITQYDESRYNIPQGTVVPVGSKLYADIHGERYYWRNNNYSCTTGNPSASCTGRVLEEDAMNY